MSRITEIESQVAAVEAMFGTVNVIVDQIDAILDEKVAEIKHLEEARNSLLNLVLGNDDTDADQTDTDGGDDSSDDAPAKPRKAPRKARVVKADTKSTPKKRTRMTSSEARRARLDASAAKRAKNGNGNGNGSDTKVSRRDQIVALLSEGLSPREIGNELGIAPNYVYHVKRDLS